MGRTLEVSAPILSPKKSPACTELSAAVQVTMFLQIITRCSLASQIGSTVEMMVAMKPAWSAGTVRDRKHRQSKRNESF